MVHTFSSVAGGGQSGKCPPPVTKNKRREKEVKRGKIKKRGKKKREKEKEEKRKRKKEKTVENTRKFYKIREFYITIFKNFNGCLSKKAPK